METALVRMDDKFRIVIPKRLRKTLGILNSTCLLVYGFEEFIFLRKAEFDRGIISDSLRRIEGFRGGIDGKA